MARGPLMHLSFQMLSHPPQDVDWTSCSMMVSDRSQLHLLYSSWLSMVEVILHGCSQSQSVEETAILYGRLETIFILFVCFILTCMHICAPSAWLKPREAGRKRWIPKNWSYRCLWNTRWVLRTTAVSCGSVLDHWNISPAIARKLLTTSAIICSSK